MRTYFQVRGGRLDEVKGEVVREQPLTIYIDGARFLTLLCSPFDLEALVLGYLWMEKVIGSLDEVALVDRMADLVAASVHYHASRGIHGAALADRARILLAAEDVGRHNAVDKIKGLALQRGIPTTDRILLSTGRVSSEMLLKAARMGVPVVASRTSPTEMAVALAEQLGVTVVGYLRSGRLNLYAGDALDLSGVS